MRYGSGGRAARLVVVAVLAVAVVATAGCGGGGGGGGSSSDQPTPEETPTTVGTGTPIDVSTRTPTAVPTPTPLGTVTDNVQPIVVNSGPTGDYVDGVFTDVTICVPGSDSGCQTISGVLVDTGSSGLRVLSSVLALALPQQTATGGEAIAECLPFLDAITWGPVRVADIQLAGERASSVPIQIIGDAGFPAAPDACTSSGLAEANTLDTLRANAILGIGAFRQDCGAACAVSGAANPGLYYACAAGSCVQTVESLSQQVQNPVWLFPQDGNGVVIDVPSVPSSGAPSVRGSLIFGIDTHANNALGAATVLTLAPQGTITTIFAGQSFGFSFLDTGSNGFFFLDATTTGIPTCSGNHDFYCPVTTRSLSATTRGANGASVPIAFDVANVNALLNGNPDNFAFDDLGGPSPNTFDWGLPFFLGRKVFTAIEGQGTPAGTGPYYAY